MTKVASNEGLLDERCQLSGSDLHAVMTTIPNNAEPVQCSFSVSGADEISW